MVGVGLPTTVALAVWRPPAVPGPLIDWVFRNLDPSGRIADRLPVRVELAGVRVADDAIRID